MDVGVHGRTDVRYSTESYGSCAAVRLGKTCPNGTARTKQRIGASRTGFAPASSSNCSSLWRNISKTLEGSISKNALWTERSFRPKKGGLGGKDQAGQRHQNYGHCRQPWSSSRLAGRKRFAG